MNRIRAGYCRVPNPINPTQVSEISLKPEDVDVIVFWTRNAAPLLPHLDELDARGFRYYFLYTALDNPPCLDPGMGPLDARIATIQTLAERLGPERIVWRYDPIVLSTKTPPQFHIETFGRIAEELRGCTKRSVISFVDLYRKLKKRLARLKADGCAIREPEEEDLRELLPSLVKLAAANGMTIQSCAEQLDLTPFGVEPGKCIDGALIERLFGISVTSQKDAAQRSACGCVASRDIGCYDTCLHGCLYCYATSNPEQAAKNHRAHDPESPQLV